MRLRIANVSMKGFPAVARRVTTQLVDDIDGSVIDDESGETIEFAINGVEYSIDLKAKNANEFHRKLDYYVGHATRVGGRKRKPTPAAASAATAAGGSARSAASSIWPPSMLTRISSMAAGAAAQRAT